METNRTTSFPAATRNDGYDGAQVIAVTTALTTGIAFYLVMTASPVSAGIAAVAAAAGFVVFALHLNYAQREANRRVAEYRKNNPDVELLRGP